jgi:hypothetical protein
MSADQPLLVHRTEHQPDAVPLKPIKPLDDPALLAHVLDGLVRLR